MIIANSRDKCLKNLKISLNLLQSLGFIINKDKCVFVPTQSCQFLGFVIDTKGFFISIPIEKETKTVNLLNKIIKKSICKIRDWAQVIGILISLWPAVKYGMLYTKNLDQKKYLSLIKNEGNYEKYLNLTDIERRDLQWWLNNLPSSHNLIRKQSFDIEIISDASTSGWGIFCNNKKSHGWWSHEESKNQINYLELHDCASGVSESVLIFI